MKRWLTPVILATQEAEISRIVVQSQSRQIVCKTLSQKKKKKSQKRAGGVAQGVGPEFKPQYCQNFSVTETSSTQIPGRSTTSLGPF
jgi:hypothetical protein